MGIPSEWKVHYVVKLQAPGTGAPCPPSALGGAGRGPRDWMPQHPSARGFSLQHSSTSCRFVAGKGRGRAAGSRLSRRRGRGAAVSCWASPSASPRAVLPAFLLLARVIAPPRFLQLVGAPLLIFSPLGLLFSRRPLTFFVPPVRHAP